MHAHDTYLRWLYRRRAAQPLRPGAEPAVRGHVLGRDHAVPCRHLEITGRKTGGPVSFPVVIADYRGERYLVSMLGANTNWVRT